MAQNKTKTSDFGLFKPFSEVPSSGAYRIPKQFFIVIQCGFNAVL